MKFLWGMVKSSSLYLFLREGKLFRGKTKDRMTPKKSSNKGSSRLLVDIHFSLWSPEGKMIEISFCPGEENLP